MRNYFIFNNIDSRDYGAYVYGANVFDAPVREFEYIQVPGRNGDLLGLERRIGNMDIAYPAIIIAGNNRTALENLKVLRAKLIAVAGYARLTDSYNTDEFRLAAVNEQFEVTTTDDLDMVKVVIKFRSKPQRYLISGETTTTITANSSSISNPTDFPSQPKITVTGYGAFYIGSQKITVANVYSSVVIDSELGDCYSGTVNANNQVTFTDNDFPVLNAGTNNITKPSTITKLEIVPRWWTV